MKLPSLQWAAAIAVATTLGTFTASAQEEPPAGGPPSPPPQGEQAGPGGRRGGPGGGGRMMGGGPGGVEALLGRLGERLGITAEQKTKIQGIAEDSRSTSRSLNDAVRKERDELRKLTQAETVDEGAIRAQAAKLATAEGDLAVQQAKTFQKLREVLTPDQLAKFKEGPGQGMRGGARRGGGGFGGGRGGDRPAPGAPPADDNEG